MATPDPVAAHPFATHLPVLRALGRALNARCVLEFGAGLYSTPEFLTLSRFPALEMLVSIERDEGWRDRIVELVGSDPRVVMPRPFPIYHESLAAYDLILIDDGQDPEDRVETIEAVVEACPPGVVVIHDFETRQYQQAADGFEHCVVFDQHTPWTAVCWNGERPELEGLSL